MSNFLCKVSDVPVGEKKLFQVLGEDILVYHLQDGWYATEAHCTHAGAVLSEGMIVDDHIIECPHHGARFDIRTGKVKSLPATHGLKIYPVVVEGDEVMLILNDEDDEECGCEGCECGSHGCKNDK